MKVSGNPPKDKVDKILLNYKNCTVLEVYGSLKFIEITFLQNTKYAQVARYEILTLGKMIWTGIRWK